jgi:UDP-glucose 4-epimerase
MELRVTHDMFGLDYVIFRPHNVYGEFQNIGDRYRNVVGIFMNQLMQEKPLTVFGDGTQTRAFSYIGDIAPVIASCVNVPAARQQVFNVGADTEYSVNELAKETMHAMGINGEIRYLESRQEVLHAHADHSKVKTVFGRRKITSLSEGLSRMATWAKSSGIRKSRHFSAIEIMEKLPPVWLEK